jgi:hypothetical protein
MFRHFTAHAMSMWINTLAPFIQVRSNLRRRSQPPRRLLDLLVRLRKSQAEAAHISESHERVLVLLELSYHRLLPRFACERILNQKFVTELHLKIGNVRSQLQKHLSFLP